MILAFILVRNAFAAHMYQFLESCCILYFPSYISCKYTAAPSKYLFHDTASWGAENQTLFKESKKYQTKVCMYPSKRQVYGFVQRIKKNPQSGTHMEHEVAQTHLVEPGGNRADRCLLSTFNFFHVKCVFSSRSSSRVENQ